MMETEITCDWIDRYNDNQLDKNERAIFEERMAANPLLRSEVDIDIRLNRFLMDDELLDLMTKIRTVSERHARGSPRMNSLLIAASLLCLALTGGMFYALRTKTDKNNVSVAQHTRQRCWKSAAEPADDTCNFHQHGSRTEIPRYDVPGQGQPGNSFEPLPEFELIVGFATRSGVFKLISPDVNLIVPAGGEVIFNWRYDGNPEPVSIVILTNHGIPLKEIQLRQTDSCSLKTRGMGGGLYYWKIIAGDEMVLMGRFTLLPAIKY
jgi:hypothetical protein